MSAVDISAHTHEHNFLGSDHRRNERRVWPIIALTGSPMVVEIAAGSMALVADGWHMSTHAGAMLITALSYLYARRHVDDSRFTFGTGKLGDLGGFASAIVLALVALSGRSGRDTMRPSSRWCRASPGPVGLQGPPRGNRRSLPHHRRGRTGERRFVTEGREAKRRGAWLPAEVEEDEDRRISGMPAPASGCLRQ